MPALTFLFGISFFREPIFAQSSNDSTTFSIRIINQSHHTLYLGRNSALDSIRAQSDIDYVKRVSANSYPEWIGILLNKSGERMLAQIEFLYNYLPNRSITVDENEIVHFQSDYREQKLDSINSAMPQPDITTISEIIRRNTSNLLSAKLLYDRFRNADMNLDTIAVYYALLSADSKRSVFGKGISDYITGRKRFTEGAIVEDFSLPDTSSTIKNLYSIRSKYILLDFWFSLCGPCLTSFPHLEDIYNNTSRATFEIVGLSVDREVQIDLWRQTIKKRNMHWINLLDSKFSISYYMYSIDNYPTTLLLDASHRIIKINPSPEEIIAIIKK